MTRFALLGPKIRWANAQRHKSLIGVPLPQDYRGVVPVDWRFLGSCGFIDGARDGNAERVGRTGQGGRRSLRGSDGRRAAGRKLMIAVKRRNDPQIGRDRLSSPSSTAASASLSALTSSAPCTLVKRCGAASCGSGSSRSISAASSQHWSRLFLRFDCTRSRKPAR